ncbi:MAG: hypothetical protein QM820_62430 [Minicystis sp.]
MVVDTLEAFLILAEARGADPGARDGAERRAKERLDRGRDHLAHDHGAPRRNELRLAVRLLSRALGEAAAAEVAPAEAAAPIEPPGRGSVLAVGAAQRWFSLGDGARVDLARRGALRLILRALVEQRQDAPGVGLDADHLFAAGWPGERALPHAAANRVYAAIATLRRLGLEPVLVRQDDGYLLDPSVAVDRQRG